MRFTNEEMVDMLLLYGECHQNATRAAQLYAQRYPNRRHPTRPTFTNIVNRLRATGRLSPRTRICSKRRTHEAAEVAVLAATAVNPHVSCRELERLVGIPRTSVMRILHRHNYHPYHVSLHQGLHGNDVNIRLEYCQWVLQQGYDFMRRVLFTDEASFTNHGNVNLHNMHYWARENPHWLRQVEHQRQWSVNVWCGIVGQHIIGPYFINGTLNGIKYRQFLRCTLPELMEDLPLDLRQIIWFQHDGCPAHNAMVVRNELNQQFPNRWIGRGSPVQRFPARSPDLTPMDFFLWGYVKNIVYQQVPTTVDDMKHRITAACATITSETLTAVSRSVMERAQRCCHVNGDVFEHTL